MQGRLVDLIIQAYEVKYYQVTGGPDLPAARSLRHPL